MSQPDARYVADVELGSCNQLSRTQERRGQVNGHNTRPSVTSKIFHLTLICVYYVYITFWCLVYVGGTGLGVSQVLLTVACFEVSHDIQLKEFCEQAFTAGAEDLAELSGVIGIVRGYIWMLSYSLHQTHFMGWKFPMGITSGDTASLSPSFSLPYLVLGTWRIFAYLIWQVILAGCSRWYLYMTVFRIHELLVKTFPHIALRHRHYGFEIFSVLAFDIICVLIAQSLAHWHFASVVLAGCLFVFVVRRVDRESLGQRGFHGWAVEFTSRQLSPSRTWEFSYSFIAIPVMYLLVLGSGFPCALMYAARVAIFCDNSSRTLAWLGGWASTGHSSSSELRESMILAGALLDLVHPNVFTVAFYNEYCP